MPPLRFLAAMIAAVNCFVSVSHAQTTFTWALPGSGNWDTTTAANWTTGPWVNGANIAVFPTLAAAGTVTLTEGITTGQIDFNTSGTTNVYTVAGNTLTLVAGGSIAVPAINVAAGSSATITSILAGTQGLNVNANGTGILTLSATSTLTGGLNILSGAVRGTTARSFGDVTNLITLSDGTTLNPRIDATTLFNNPLTLAATATSASIVLNRNVSTTATNANAEFGNLTMAGGQTLNITTNTNGYNLTFMTTTFTGSGVPIINLVTAPQGLTRFGALVGSNGLRLTGAGRLALNTNSPSFSGGISVEGTSLLQVRTATAAGVAGTLITLGTGTTLEPRNDASTTFAFNVASAATATAVTISTDRVGANTGNTLTIGTFTGAAALTQLNVTGGNSYQLAVGAVSFANTDPVTLNIGSTNTSGRTIFTSTVTSTGGIIKTGQASLTLNANSAATLTGPVSFSGTNPGQLIASITGALGSNATAISIPSLAGLNVNANSIINDGQTLSIAQFGELGVLNNTVGASQGSAASTALVLGTNVTAAAGAILARGTVDNTTPNGFIGNLPATPTYYFGVSGNLVNQNITIGTGTPWLGFSNDRGSDRLFSGTVTAAAGTTDIDARVTPGSTFFLNNGTNPLNFAATTPFPVLTFRVADTATTTTATIRVDARATTYQIAAVVVERGVTYDVRSNNAFGTDTTTAANNPAVTFKNGSTFNPSSVPLLVNANLAFESGSVLQLDDGTTTNGNLGYTGGAVLTIQTGGIINMVSAEGLRNSTAANIVTQAGSIVRMGVDNIVNLDLIGNNAGIYTITGGTRLLTNGVLTLDGGFLVTDGTNSRTFGANAANGLRIGANGATFGAGPGATLTLGSTANPLPILLDGGVTSAVINLGTSAVIEGQARTGGFSFPISLPNFSAGITFNVNFGTITPAVANAFGPDATNPANNPNYVFASGTTFNPANSTTVTNNTNANMTFLAGARLQFDDASNLNGITGNITLNTGAIVDITNVTAPAGTFPAAGLSANPGVIVRLGASNIAPLQTVFGERAIYRVTGADRSVTAGNFTLNGGGLTNDGSSRTFSPTTTGNDIVIGVNGATFAATTATNLSLSGNWDTAGSGNPLTIGSLATIDGNTKAGTVVVPSGASRSFLVGSINIVAGGLTFSGGGGSYGTTGGVGAITAQSGTTLRSDTGAIINAAVNLLAGSTGRWTVNTSPAVASLEGAGTLILGNTTGTGTVPFAIGANNLSTTFSGPITQATGFVGNITKTGTGTLTLTGTNTYTGTTTVSNGRLNVSGDHTAATGAVTVSAGATGGVLGGVGTIGGAVTVNGTGAVPGTLSAGSGDGRGTLTLTNGLTTANLSRWIVQLYGEAPGGIADSGTSTVLSDTPPLYLTNNYVRITAGTTTIDLGMRIVVDTAAGSLVVGQPYSYRVAEGAGTGTFTIPDTQITFTGPYGAEPGATFTADGSGSLFLNFTPTPEPGLLLGLGALALGFARRSRR